MSPKAGFVLMDQIAPRLRATVPHIRPMGSEDAEECFGENDRWVAPFVRATVRHVLTAQKEFLETQMLAVEVCRS